MADPRDTTTQTDFHETPTTTTTSEKRELLFRLFAYVPPLLAPPVTNIFPINSSSSSSSAEVSALNKSNILHALCNDPRRHSTKNVIMRWLLYSTLCGTCIVVTSEWEDKDILLTKGYYKMQQNVAVGGWMDGWMTCRCIKKVPFNLRVLQILLVILINWFFVLLITVLFSTLTWMVSYSPTSRYLIQV